jgi:YHS domain-containing protein
MGSLLEYLVELIFLIVIGKVLGGALRVFFHPAPVRGEAHPSARANQVRTGKTARDPICGMFVSTELSHFLVRGSETLHFCSHECLERYQKEMANASV